LTFWYTLYQVKFFMGWKTGRDIQIFWIFYWRSYIQITYILSIYIWQPLHFPSLLPSFFPSGRSCLPFFPPAPLLWDGRRLWGAKSAHPGLK
jgi:hypothetical protein